MDWLDNMDTLGRAPARNEAIDRAERAEQKRIEQEERQRQDQERGLAPQLRKLEASTQHMGNTFLRVIKKQQAEIEALKESFTRSEGGASVERVADALIQIAKLEGEVRQLKTALETERRERINTDDAHRRNLGNLNGKLGQKQYPPMQNDDPPVR